MILFGILCFFGKGVYCFRMAHLPMTSFARMMIQNTTLRSGVVKQHQAVPCLHSWRFASSNAMTTACDKYNREPAGLCLRSNTHESNLGADALSKHLVLKATVPKMRCGACSEDLLHWMCAQRHQLLHS